jgi:hypothetical protein
MSLRAEDAKEFPMGVSLGYFSTKPVSEAHHQEIMALASAANEAYEWWCEPIWISGSLEEAGNVFGFTKLFCLIDDDNTDTYMAYLDVCEIVRFLTSVAERFDVEWRVDIEDSTFGVVTKAGPDEMLEENLSGFLEMFPGDFEVLQSQPREAILAKWSDR